MNLKVIAVFAVVVAFCIPIVAAREHVDQDGGYIVTPASLDDRSFGIVPIVPLVAGSITQGQANWYSRLVTSGTTSMIVDLNWADTSDSLTLTIYAPDGTLGPYYDADDGRIDGRVYLLISQFGGLTEGTWYYKIYGERIQGSQGYTFVTY